MSFVPGQRARRLLVRAMCCASGLVCVFPAVSRAWTPTTPPINIAVFGGIKGDRGQSVAVDASGNVYTTGYFTETVDFDPGAGTVNVTAVGNSDAFVSKLDSSGDLVWVKQLGGVGFDVGYSVAVDAAGNVYVTGSFMHTADFDPGAGTTNLTSSGGFDAFVVKLNSSGGLAWAKKIGGVSDEYGSSVAVDAAGNVYSSGSFQTTADFDPGVGTANMTSAGSADVFVSKLNSSGDLVWAKQFGGVGGDGSYSVTVDRLGGVYTTGLFQFTADFDPGAGTANLTAAGGFDAFVVKLNSSGDLVWAKQLGGSDYDGGFSVVVDASGNSYLTGYFQGTADFDPGAGTANLISAGAADVFVLKLDSSGGLVWVKQFGGIDSDNGFSIARDGSGNLYVAGDFQDTADFDPGAGTTNLTSVGYLDAFVLKLDSSGGLVWVKQFGGVSYDYGNSVAMDRFGDAYVTGFFDGSADFDPGAGTVNVTSAGSEDVFVVKLSASGEVTTPPTTIPTTTVPSTTIPSSGLPGTGSSSRAMLMWSVLVLTSGWMMIRLSRRRNSSIG